MKQILFVCTGNTCRSPMAEAIMKHLIKDSHAPIQVSSCGVSTIPGSPVSAFATEALREKGIIHHSESQNLQPELLHEYDYVLTMTLAHQRYIQSLYPAFRHKVHTFYQFVTGNQKDIMDPFGQGLVEYQACVDEIYGLSLKLLVKKELQTMKIAIGSDHAGFHLKKQLIEYLHILGYDVIDLGCETPDSVDYPDYAQKVCKKVQENEVTRGILICGTGIGMSIAANKMKGIRCALVHDLFSAKATREHNDSNVLAMGERVIGVGVATEIVKTWLETPFLEQTGHHAARVKKMMCVEHD